jgi:hypothetical protein
VKKNIKEIEAIFNRSGLTANIEFKELNILLGLYGGEDLSEFFIFIFTCYPWTSEIYVKQGPLMFSPGDFE